MNGNTEIYFMSLSGIFKVSIVQSCTVQALWPILKVSACFFTGGQAWRIACFLFFQKKMEYKNILLTKMFQNFQKVFEFGP